LPFKAGHTVFKSVQVKIKFPCNVSFYEIEQVFVRFATTDLNLQYLNITANGTCKVARKEYGKRFTANFITPSYSYALCLCLIQRVRILVKFLWGDSVVGFTVFPTIHFYSLMCIPKFSFSDVAGSSERAVTWSSPMAEQELLASHLCPYQRLLQTDVTRIFLFLNFVSRNPEARNKNQNNGAYITNENAARHSLSLSLSLSVCLPFSSAYYYVSPTLLNLWDDIGLTCRAWCPLISVHDVTP